MAQESKLRAVHLCDTVRRDSKGLPTLVNIYPGKVYCPIKPWYQTLTVFLAFEKTEGSEPTISIRVSAPDFSTEGEATMGKQGRYFDLNLPFAVVVPDEGEIRVDWKVDAGRWRKASSWVFEFPPEPQELTEEEEEGLRKYYRARASVHETLEFMEFRAGSVRYA